MIKQKKRIKKAVIVLLIIAGLITFSVVFTKLNPQDIVSSIGIKNSYGIIMFFGFLGGISILFPFPYYLFLFAFGAGGANPILLGICSGIGVIIGESTSYLVGYQGGETFSEKYQKYFNKVDQIFSKTKNSFLLSLFLFVYGAFVPLPNDIVILPLGAMKYSYWRMIIPLGLGNIVFGIIVAYSGMFGWKWFLSH